MPYRPVNFRETDLRRAIRSAVKEDLDVAGFEITKDGVIRVLTAPPDHPPVEALSHDQ